MTIISSNILICLFCLIWSLIGYLNNINYTILFILFNISLLIYLIRVWLHNIKLEFIKNNKLYNNRLFFIGFNFFIFTEVIIFSSLFILYLFYSINPNIYIGNIWSYLNNILYINTFVHFKMTSILMNISLISISLTISILSPFINNKANLIDLFEYILLFAIIFIVTHIIILYNESFNISNSINDSISHLIINIHFIHVFIGLIMLVFTTNKILFINIHKINNYYINNIYIKCLCYYWHFIDIIWICIYITQYVDYDIHNLLYYSFII